MSSAARRTARRILGYVQHRQTFPASSAAILASSGRETRLSSAAVAVSQPGVQYPHCIAPVSSQACCTGCSRPSSASPSTVVIRWPATSAAGVEHAVTARRPISTVQAPHAPSPQPSFGPVMPRSSRSTSSRLRPPSATTCRWTPLTVIVNGMRGPFLLPAARPVSRNSAGDRHASLPEIVCIPLACQATRHSGHRAQDPDRRRGRICGLRLTSDCAGSGPIIAPARVLRKNDS